jgi:hypothetical protein
MPSTAWCSVSSGISSLSIAEFSENDLRQSKVWLMGTIFPRGPKGASRCVDLSFRNARRLAAHCAQRDQKMTTLGATCSGRRDDTVTSRT